MAKVVDLERQRVEQLARELVPILRERRQIIRRVADVENVERFRRAGRCAGRLLGVPVRTGVNDHGVVIVSR